MRWKFLAEGEIYASPAIGQDGTIYFTAIQKGNGGLYALSPSGAKKWASGKQIPASAPALAANGNIYVVGAGGLQALTLDGWPKWSTFLASGSTVDLSPTIGPDGTVYVGGHATGPDGQIKWAYQTPGSPLGCAVGTDGTIYVASAGGGAGTIFALDTNGKEKWHFAATGDVGAAPAIGADGSLYFGVGDDAVVAIDANGAVKWTFSTGDKVGTTPSLASDGTVYVAANHTLFALAPDGAQRWAFTSAGSIMSSAAVDANGTIYVGAGYVLHALAPDGTTTWMYDANAIISAPAIGADGSVYVGAGTTLYAFGPKKYP